VKSLVIFIWVSDATEFCKPAQEHEGEVIADPPDKTMNESTLAACKKGVKMKRTSNVPH
jgi:hypothetical protein